MKLLVEKEIVTPADVDKVINKIQLHTGYRERRR